ncbi:hypothetical protein [Streptomyces sp. NPDC051079]|uniref:hypothetical protein n=1 Tax=Streptomyces sp. NPDC051079 TaxID=3155043 RepID=UPI00344C9E03
MPTTGALRFRGRDVEVAAAAAAWFVLAWLVVRLRGDVGGTRFAGRTSGPSAGSPGERGAQAPDGRFVELGPGGRAGQPALGTSVEMVLERVPGDRREAKWMAAELDAATANDTDTDTDTDTEENT